MVLSELNETDVAELGTLFARDRQGDRAPDGRLPVAEGPAAAAGAARAGARRFVVRSCRRAAAARPGARRRDTSAGRPASTRSGIRCSSRRRCAGSSATSSRPASARSCSSSSPSHPEGSVADVARVAGCCVVESAVPVRREAGENRPRWLARRRSATVGEASVIGCAGLGARVAAALDERSASGRKGPAPEEPAERGQEEVDDALPVLDESPRNLSINPAIAAAPGSEGDRAATRTTSTSGGGSWREPASGKPSRPDPAGTHDRGKLALAVVPPRRILHLDMDAFFAAVELLRRPELKGQPVVIGGRGDPSRRGVVSTATYEAREFGIRSAMPLRTAYKLCPQAVFLAVDFAEYRRYSALFKAEMHGVSPLMEDRGIDEAYLDITEVPGSSEEIAADQAADRRQHRSHLLDRHRIEQAAREDGLGARQARRPHDHRRRATSSRGSGRSTRARSRGSVRRRRRASRRPGSGPSASSRRCRCSGSSSPSAARTARTCTMLRTASIATGRYASRAAEPQPRDDLPGGRRRLAGDRAHAREARPRSRRGPARRGLSRPRYRHQGALRRLRHAHPGEDLAGADRLPRPRSARRRSSASAASRSTAGCGSSGCAWAS